MSTYLMDVMCANIEFPSLEWKWESSLPSVHVYRKMLWENKYKEDYDQICNKVNINGQYHNNGIEGIKRISNIKEMLEETS